MDIIYAIILGIVEGLTEFLPISSTGHLLVASALLSYPPVGDFRNTFDIFIQVGAIFAVLVYFGRDIIQQASQIPTHREVQRFWINIIIAFLPAAVIGLLFHKQIEAALFNPTTVGITLILGGIVFLVVEMKERPSTVHTIYEITPVQALLVGIAQIVSLIPGVSRSGSTIVGGLLAGLDRKVATRFTFYIAIPTLGAATFYSLFTALKDGSVHSSELGVFAVGTVVAFIVAWASIAWLLRFVANNNFRVFGVYRIIAGIVILALAFGTKLLSN